MDDRTGWQALLGGACGTDAVTAAQAPGRLVDFSRPPPAHVEVGELDLFRDENVAYAQGLWRAGVPTEPHVRPGVPHGFDQMAPTSEVSRRAVADHLRVPRSC